MEFEYISGDREQDKCLDKTREATIRKMQSFSCMEE